MRRLVRWCRNFRFIGSSYGPGVIVGMSANMLFESGEQVDFEEEGSAEFETAWV